MTPVPDDVQFDDQFDDEFALGARPGWFLAVLAVVAIAGYIGASILVDRVAEGTLAAGPQLIEVPNLAGEDESEATAALDDAGLSYSISTAQNVQIPAGVVIAQRPSSGERVEADTVVELTVSVGDGFARVPDIRGSNLGELQLLLFTHGLALGDVGFEDANNPADEVIGQLPAPGEVVAVGGIVHVMASSGPPSVEIPDVRRLSYSEARRALVDVGFDTELRDSYSGSVPRGGAISTTPDIGDEAARGDRITIYVSLGPAPRRAAPPPPPPPPEEPAPAPTSTAPIPATDPVPLPPIPAESFAPSTP